jgi:o-succinylbenzoate synthase
MNLQELSLQPFHLVLRSPLQRAGSAHQNRDGILVLLGDEEGRLGWGEATPLVEFGTEDLKAAGGILSAIALKVPGIPGPQSLGEVDTLIARFPELEDAPAARCALESALLDLAAQRQGIPLAKLLNASARSSVSVNALLSAFDAKRLAEEAAAAVAAGYGVVKVKVASRALSDDAKRLIAVRKTVGDQVKIRIDANGAWTEAEAATALRGLSPLNLELCEQPVAAGNHAALRRLRWLVSCPLAADEAVSQPGAQEVLLDGEDGPVADLLVLKPMALGGLLPALRLAERANRLGVGSYVTSALDGVIARLGAAHLAAALPNSNWASGLAIGHLFERDVGPDPCPPRQGEIRLGDGPGLGLASDWSVG